jgi:hypothetical protein
MKKITPKRTIVYFTDSRLEEGLDSAVRKQLLKAANGIPIISVSQKPIDFGKNICVGIKPRSYLSLYQQLLIGIKAAQPNTIIFSCEHDVFYNPEYFEFTPPRENRIFFNRNRYYWQRNSDCFYHAHGNRALSQGVGHKGAFLNYAREQVRKRKDNVPCLNKGAFDNFTSKYPNVDIRHGGNFSQSWVFVDEDQSKHEPLQTRKLDYWGNANDFQNAVGYKNIDVGAAEILHERFNPNGDENPVQTDIKRSGFPELFNSFGFKKGAEVGVKRGVFSLHLCKNMPELTLTCVDPYIPTQIVHWDVAESFFEAAQKVIKKYDAQIIKKTSMHAAAEDVPKWSLDFVHIDADHSFDEVIQDIIVWTARVRPGGIVTGHDYDNPEVKAAIDTYAKIHGHELFITRGTDEKPSGAQSWFFARGG